MAYFTSTIWTLCWVPVKSYSAVFWCDSRPFIFLSWKNMRTGHTWLCVHCVICITLSENVFLLQNLYKSLTQNVYHKSHTPLANTTAIWINITNDCAINRVFVNSKGMCINITLQCITLQSLAFTNHKLTGQIQIMLFHFNMRKEYFNFSK